MVQYRRVVFNPGEELNVWIDRMQTVLNSVRTLQTCTEQHHSNTRHIEFRSPVLKEAVYWSSTLPFPAQWSYNPYPQILTPSYNPIQSILHFHVHRSSEVWQGDLFSFPLCYLLEICTYSMRQCHSLAATQHLQWRFPTQLSHADFNAFWSPFLPHLPYQRLLPDISWGSSGFFMWNYCD